MRYIGAVLVAILSSSWAFASPLTNGPLGINADTLPLTGAGIAIGQVEIGRPGVPLLDDPQWVNIQVQPTQVYAGASIDSANSSHVTYAPGTPLSQRYGLHATLVAGVMIGKGGAVKGVAPDALLYAGADGAVTGVGDDIAFSVTANRIASLPANVRAINVSEGRILTAFTQKTDGNQPWTQFIDWSAQSSVHDVLYVVSGSEESVPLDVPQDNFNGITVGASERIDGEGAFRRVSTINILDFDAEPGSRTSIDIIAPGVDLTLAGQGNDELIGSGTSFAAPHVTGTVALLQEYADAQILTVGGPHWTSDANRHEVMKTILLNSADKMNGVHGSARTVVRKDGTPFILTSAGVFSDISLDEEMGAGHLNAKSAYDNFSAGQHAAGTVPAVGWNYGAVGAGNTDEYIIDQPVSKYVAITLAWDRQVVKTSDGPYLVGDDFFDYDSSVPNGLDTVMSNMDVFLTRISDGVRVDASDTLHDNLEHIFFNVGDNPANYKIEVVHTGAGPTEAQDYALAWWAGELPAPVPGDFNGDGQVDGADLQSWKDGFGTAYDGNDFLVWQRNFGFGVPSSPTSAAVPEPAAWMLLVIGLPLLLRRRSM